MAISSPGIGSNLDINSIVSQLMQAEARPLQQLATKEASFQAKLSAYGSIKSALSSFQTAMNGLTSVDKFSTSKVAVGDKDILTASASANVAPGKFTVEVQNLAQAQKLKSGPYTNTTDTLGSGTITIEFGGYSGGVFTPNADKATETIEIDTGDSSLASVRDAINAADVGVTASIVNDGTSNRLVIGSSESGLENTLRITVNDDDGDNTNATGLSALHYDASSGGTMNMSETVEAKNAVLIVDGMTITKSSNTVDDAIDGVTLNLVKEAVGEPTTVTITRDNAGAKTAVEGFVKAYNDLTQTLSNLSAYNAETKQAAVLQGDSTVRSLQARLRNLLNTALTAGGGGLTRMSDIGVSVQTDGTLKLDNTKLTAALNNPSKDVATLFAAIAKPTDSLVSFVGASTSAPEGAHDLNITQLATQGKAAGSVAAQTTIVAGVNDSIMLSVDGTDTTITLTAGTYTASTLAAHLQSKINGSADLSDNDIEVSVTESAGVLTVTSNRYGSASLVEIIGGIGAADLFGTATSTDGVDVEGTIGGQPATGSGRKLTGLGISVEIEGGTLGDRGSISFARGFAARAADLASQLLEEDGTLDGRTEGLDRTIKDIAKRREEWNVRLTAIEKRYRAQFIALDAMMSSMLSTSEYLKQQLANLPKAGE